MTVKELIERLQDVPNKDAEIRFEDMNDFTTFDFEFLGTIQIGDDKPIFRIYVELGY